MKTRTLGCVILAAQLAACSHNPLFKGYSAEPAGAALLTPYAELRKALSSGSEVWVSETCFGVVATADKAKCQWQRNQTIAALVLGSEEACMEHRRSIYGREAAYNIGLGSATNLFAGWAAVLTKTHPYRSSILGALALFSNSERSLINETVYKTMIVPVVDKKIVEGRDAKVAVLHGKMGKSIDDYGVAQALSDWEDFHKSCSFMTGLQKALDEGNQTGDMIRLERLNQAYRSVSFDQDNACRASPSSETCQQLTERLRQLDQQIVTLQTK